MINKKNLKLKKVLSAATVLAILTVTPTTQVFANTTGAAVIENEGNLDNHKKAEDLVKKVIIKVDTIIGTENLKEMNIIFDEIVQLRRDLVKRMGISTEDELINQIKAKTQALGKRIQVILPNKVESEQQRLNNLHKSSVTVPLVANPNWYNSGFPQEVKVREIESTPDTVIIDVVAQKDKELKGDGLCYAANPIDVMGNDYYSRFPIDLTLLSDTAGRGEIKGYLDKNGSFHKTPETLPNGYYKSGEVLYSVVVDANSPMVKGTKIINSSYWNLCIGTTLGKNESTNLTKDIYYGVDTSEAINIVKTTGTNLSVGGEIGASNTVAGKASINYSIQESLSRAFSRSISISNRETYNIRHVFEKNGKERKVGLYQFIEKFEQIPNSEYNIYWSMTNFEMAQNLAENNDIKLVFNRSSELKTRAFTTLDIEEGQTSINYTDKIK